MTPEQALQIVFCAEPDRDLLLNCVHKIRQVLADPDLTDTDKLEQIHALTTEALT